MEMCVPIPQLEDGTPDWNIVQEVVYDLRDVAAGFEAEDKYPWDLAMEDRFMAGTDMLLGAQHGNTATLCIETTASTLVPLTLWEEFKEAVAANWANEFPRAVNGVSITDYMRSVYEPQLPAYVQG